MTHLLTVKTHAGSRGSLVGLALRDYMHSSQRFMMDDQSWILARTGFHNSQSGVASNRVVKRTGPRAAVASAAVSKRPTFLQRLRSIFLKKRMTAATAPSPSGSDAQPVVEAATGRHGTGMAVHDVSKNVSTSTLLTVRPKGLALSAAVEGCAVPHGGRNLFRFALTMLCAQMQRGWKSPKERRKTIRPQPPVCGKKVGGKPSLWPPA